MPASSGLEPGAPNIMIHATAIAVGGRAVLIRGPSGAGKSDLALRCLGSAPNPLVPEAARLVSDDQVMIERQGAGLRASAPPAIAGKLEIRGLGIFAVTAAGPSLVALVADLVSSGEIERYPLTTETVTLLGVALPLVRLAPFEAASPLKLLLALAAPTLWSR